MNDSSPELSNPQIEREAAGLRSPLATVLSVIYAGLLAGTIDIGMAAWIGWLSPAVILHAVASGVVGRAAFFGGMKTALIGLGLQWGMACLIAAIYAFGMRRFIRIRRHWIPFGVIYGVVVYVVMNFLVVPLSAAPFKTDLSPVKVVENLLAMILFGLIVAAFSRQSRPGRS